MCAPQWLRYLLGAGIPHTSCLSPVGYSTVYRDYVSIDPLPLKLPLALAYKAWTQALPLIPHGLRVGMTVAGTTRTVIGSGSLKRGRYDAQGCASTGYPGMIGNRVNRLGPSLALPLSPAKLKTCITTGGRGLPGLSLLRRAGRECAGFLPFTMSPSHIGARPPLLNLEREIGFPANGRIAPPGHHEYRDDLSAFRIVKELYLPLGGKGIFMIYSHHQDAPGRCRCTFMCIALSQL